MAETIALIVVPTVAEAAVRVAALGEQGPPGETGPQGATGATGAQGATGSQGPAGSGDMLAANNLSELPSKPTARSNLGLVAIAASGSASDLSAGTVPDTRMPAHTGDVTSSAGFVALTIANAVVTFAKMATAAIATAANYLANAASVLLTPNAVWSAAAPVALTDAATIAVDMNTFINATVTLAGNRTLGNPTNAKPGQSGSIWFTQDGTGNRTLALASNWKIAGGSPPTLSTAAGAVDRLDYVVRTSSIIDYALSKGVA